MTRTLGIFVALCAFVAVTLAAEEKLYSDKYDFVDVDSVLSNERIRTQYYNCFLETAPCLTPDAKFFKDKFPEAIVTKCRKCTSKQKESFEKIVVYYSEKEPEKWKAVLTKAITESQKKKA